MHQNPGITGSGFVHSGRRVSHGVTAIPHALRCWWRELLRECYWVIISSALRTLHHFLLLRCSEAVDLPPNLLPQRQQEQVGQSGRGPWQPMWLGVCCCMGRCSCACYIGITCMTHASGACRVRLVGPGTAYMHCGTPYIPCCKLRLMATSLRL
jgi:hypothetical protein